MSRLPEREAEGYKTNRTELLHYELPTDGAAARKLLGRWRRLALPPAGGKAEEQIKRLSLEVDR